MTAKELNKKYKGESINSLNEYGRIPTKEGYPQEYQFGQYKCVDGYAEYYNIGKKGLCKGIRMYMDMSSKDKTTYCLFQRADNKKFFYCEIVPAPERGPKETKFLPLPLSKVPQLVRQDFGHPHQ